MAITLSDAISITIKEIRKRKGLSQEDLALISGIDRTYISGIERKNRNPTINSIEKITSALEVSNSEFLSHAMENIKKWNT